MNLLEQVIIEKIRKEGPITFETFMDMALYYPELGYYSSPEITIGREGDFYTSPHLHPMFGTMIGRQLMEMWIIMGRPSLFHAVEIGAGAGYLCKDIFDYVCEASDDSLRSQDNQDKNDFFRSLRYVIVEPFSHFEGRQRELLEGDTGLKSKDSICWVKSLEDLYDVSGCILSNELLDAFPVHLVEMDDGTKEVYINYDGEEFKEVLNTISTRDITEYTDFFSIHYTSGYRTEINLRIREWLKSVSEVLTQGYLLTIDYGYTAREYYSDDRTTGTLLCYHKHKLIEHPCQNIGEQDITAHVNFSSIKKWGEDFGFKTLGYCPQGTFLISSGIDEMITERYSGSPGYLSEVSKIKGLIMPQGMGESHNVMIQYKGKELPEKLRGFSMRNLVRSL